MNRILHILNGDFTAQAFEQTALDGDVVIWREVLSEGPLLKDVASAQFWKHRREWICNTFDDTEDNYTTKVIDEVGKLNAEYDEINLWFDFDMHCQINLLGVLNLLKHQVDLSQPRIYLISPDDYPELAGFRAISQLDGSQLEGLYDSRLGVSEIEFYASGISWSLLIENDPAEITAWVNSNKYWGNLHWLFAALQAHVKRTIPNENGLNSVEQALLDIYNSGISTKNELFKQFWLQYPIYGMGDKELDLYVAGLQKRQSIQIDD